ncbi:MAG: MgtC/SapB family protein [Bryobacteraceae bacterium]
MDQNQLIRAVVEALLIGFLFGAEREASREETERQPGIRDFMVIAQVGAVCALLGNIFFAAAALLAIAALLAVFHWQVPERSGVTTEMAAVSTFCLAFLAATPSIAHGSTVAIGLTIVMVFLLEAKRSLHKFIRETVTETEFNHTLRFLALIFIIYPVLPPGAYGPNASFAPRQIWLFVILVSSISFLGYFLEKFLGSRAGLRLTGALGGLASTTAATAAFARSTAEEPHKLRLYWQAGMLANAMQFPRVLAILAVASPTLARALLFPLVAAAIAGAGAGWLADRGRVDERTPMGLRNPLRLLPALKFGLLFAAIVFLSKEAAAVLGPDAGIWVAAAGGSVDADAATLAASGLLSSGDANVRLAAAAIVLALAANAAVKVAIAAYAGSLPFARRMALGFVIMFGAGAAAWFTVP